ncbi:hypothetical protein M407DRAFT_11189 [Tulasnella calospora MUT 4182]|uniref:Uncharacterized protein n=1 Tax=Tulasnella calospora MUT 4182 TaxID=1051891 RepID=A0A0C3KEK3_9AGAM|nr:hypothetical protein M407DRAFT_11189 [Tulasnella calospora MUT 4182]
MVMEHMIIHAAYHRIDWNKRHAVRIRKKILLAWQHFTWTLEGMMQGEDVWCGAMMDAIYKLGYSMIIARPEHLNDAHRRYHKNVHLVIWEAADDCIYNPHCVYADFEDGSSERILVPSPNATHLNMPIWKPFHPSWWNNPVEPLTGPFTLSPEPYELWPPGRNAGKENFYLGYTVEPSCMDTPYVPHEERPRQAYIFGKYLGYFLLKEYTLWDEMGGMKGSLDDDFYLDFSQKENVTFLAGHLSLSQVPAGFTDPPRGIIQHERLSRPEFQKMIANSRVMIGLSNPFLSPTPYEALCLGIPSSVPSGVWTRTIRTTNRGGSANMMR